MEKAYDGRSSSKDAGESRRITRADYAAAQTKMQAMVDKGEMTQAQMDERLGAMRRMIGAGGGKRE